MSKPNFNALLRMLDRLGMTAPWQACLLLPTQHEDLRSPCTDLSQAPLEVETYFELTCTGAPQVRRDGRTPRLAFGLQDAAGMTARGLVFGFFDAFRQHLQPGSLVRFLGRARWMGDILVIAVREVVPERWHGAIRPVYAAVPRVATADDVRDQVLALVAATSNEAVRALCGAVGDVEEKDLCSAIGCPGWTLAQILAQTHRPRSLEYGAHAIRALERVAALAVLRRARESDGSAPTATRWKLSTIASRISNLPFALTADQHAAINDIVEDLASGTPMRRCLTGDVGSGKTCVFGAVLAALCDAGGRGLVLLPNEPLAQQVAREVSTWWPDLPVVLVTSETGAIPNTARLFIGTTALNHRTLPTIDLVAVDEQQRFADSQRRHHVRQGTHLLESTATCIPRTLALAKYGFLAVSMLRRGPHAKTIRTQRWTASERREVFEAVRQSIAAGHQVLVVYPRRDGSGAGTLPSVEEAFSQWERAFPSLVRALTGADEGEDKAAALADMREGRAAILVATTVVEVGINLEKLRHVVIVHPERLGLSTLHQIRGRAARQGGEGRCDLYCRSDLKPDQIERLSVLEATQDGFAVAEADLRLRGFGDLGTGSRQQSGADNSCLFGRPLPPEAVEAMLPFWTWLSHSAKARP